MTFPVVIEPRNGQFAAVLLGAPNVCGRGQTLAEAVAALKEEIAQRMARGELLSLEIQSSGVSGLSGKYRDDPTLADIRDEAYQLRDAEPQE